MASQTSGVLVIGTTRSEHLDFGADFLESFTEAKEYLRAKKPSVIVFRNILHAEELDDFCAHAMDTSPESLWILSCEQLSSAQILKWTSFGRLHDLIENFADPELEVKLQSALEASGELAQRRNLAEMIEDQSLQLKRLTAELEARVQRRHRTLRTSLDTLEQTKARLHAFHNALLGIHRASTILQMERTLNEALHETIDLSWVRLRFENQSSLARQTGQNILAVELPLQPNLTPQGEVLFAKPEGKSFAQAEVDFLYEISEALALALSRLHKLEQAETLKAQWQATFDSIPHPLCLTNSDFDILKLNRAFQQACVGRSFRDLVGKNCFQTFFGDEFRPSTPLEVPFTFRNARTGQTETEHFEVSGERMGVDAEGHDVRLVLMRSITDEVRFERRILEASKLAELGTIGSSIAHELNNPLGGMLSFLQLILMEIKDSDPIFTDVKRMEQAVFRCRDIIQNLLSFARKQDLGDFSEINLGEVVTRSVKLIELQSKSMGINIEMISATPAPVAVSGSINALSQAMCNLLQNAIDAIHDRLKADPLFPGKIRIEIDSDREKCYLRVCDNGTGIRPEVQSQIFNPLFTTRDPGRFGGMGLTTAFTIIAEHHGSLEILSQTGSGTTAIISLPRLDLPPERRLFDGEI
ncbi:MAG: nitrogen regulation protein NR(II) [Bdellovibrionales bacterium]